jgi:hypothetical protein
MDMDTDADSATTTGSHYSGSTGIARFMEGKMEKKPKCRICDDTGFYRGKICPCITGKNTGNVPPIFSDIFAGLWGTTPGKQDTNGGQSDGQKDQQK